MCIMDLCVFFEENEIICDWREVDVDELGKILAANIGINEKYRNLSTLLFATRKPDKKAKEGFPYSEDAIVRLMAGGTCKLKRYIYQGKNMMNLDQ